VCDGAGDMPEMPAHASSMAQTQLWHLTSLLFLCASFFPIAKLLPLAKFLIEDTVSTISGACRQVLLCHTCLLC